MRLSTIVMLCVAPLLAGAAAGASASVVVMGNSLGRECYLAAALKRDARVAIGICSEALAGTLSQRDRAATHVNRGVIYAEAHNLEKALLDYDEALRIHADFPEAHVNRGIVLLQAGGRDREAIEALTRGIVMGTPRVEVAYYTRAMAYEVLGNVRAAYEDYHAAADAKPDWDAPREQLKRFSVVRNETGRG